MDPTVQTAAAEGGGTEQGPPPQQQLGLPPLYSPAGIPGICGNWPSKHPTKGFSVVLKENKQRGERGGRGGEVRHGTAEMKKKRETAGEGAGERSSERIRK